MMSMYRRHACSSQFYVSAQSTLVGIPLVLCCKQNECPQMWRAPAQAWVLQIPLLFCSSTSGNTFFPIFRAEVLRLKCYVACIGLKCAQMMM